MTDVPYKKGKFRNWHTERMPNEDEGRDWGDVSISQRTPKISGKHQEVGKRHGQIVSHRLRRKQSC